MNNLVDVVTFSMGFAVTFGAMIAWGRLKPSPTPQPPQPEDTDLAVSLRRLSDSLARRMPTQPSLRLVRGGK